jgi:hypothetical protein
MNTKNLNSICTFSFGEKLYAQFTFNAGVIVASYGLFLESTILGIAYLLYSYIGILLVIRYTICPRCPHLCISNDCVQMHSSIMKMIVSPRRHGPLNVYEKILFFMVLYGIFILPINWIASNTVILLLFLLLYGGHLLGLQIHFCSNCQHKSCIQNRNKKSIDSIHANINMDSEDDSAVAKSRAVD